MQEFPSPLTTLKELLANNPPGNGWVKVNLHVHGHGHDPEEIVSQARKADIDLIAITDHQTFRCHNAIAEAASKPGRRLTVLPGIEITALEGVHLLAVFPASYSRDAQKLFYGWLVIDGSGNTGKASEKTVREILQKVEKDEGGIIVVPHPFTEDIGFLDSARKINTRTEWLDSGYIRLFQISEKHRCKIKYIGHDEEGNWINRYVLATANPTQIRESRYCLAPFNRSDAHSPDDIADGCSWFRMQELGVEGLKQVACEPGTRISLESPPPPTADFLLGLEVEGGYCQGQLFRFNPGLNCLVGQNHAGKSTVLDLIRFAIGQDKHLQRELRPNLLGRLNATLGADGHVTLYTCRQGKAYAIVRKFVPSYSPGPDSTVSDCLEDPLVYSYSKQDDELIREERFDFPIEVYEQGRIHELRSNVHRQLEMLDDFAGLSDLQSERRRMVTELQSSADNLAPLSEEQERLNSELAVLPTLREELDEKDEQFSDEESEQWAKAEAFVGDIEGLIDALSSAAGEIPEPDASVVVDADQPLHRLFAQRPPVLDTTAVAHADILAQWNDLIRRVLGDIEAARQTIVSAVERLQRDSGSARGAWKEAKQAHDRTVTERLKKAGFVSPSELINRVAELRSQINTLEKVTKPRLIEVQELVSQAEVNRDKLFTDLEELDAAISTKRQQKAHDLTEAVGDHVQVHVEPFANREAYLATLDRLARSSDRRIQNRNAQLRAITEKIRPIELVRTLAQGGCLPRRRGLVTRLDQLCGITEHTQNVLCGMAKDAQLIAELATVQVPDVPRIRVQRRGEKTFADIRTGLSPGEQSAAILTLALQTRTAPLILDQPEDELGYSYVVHLIVPKILQAKFARQILVVTHNANIPVLGDADLVIKMENHPLSENDRRCVQTACGCFESPDVTAALLELEGGAQAFQYRQHRYAITGTKA